MNNKMNNMLNKFLESTNVKDEEELNEELQQFIKNLSLNEEKYENTILDDAYEMLEKAENAKTKSQAIKFAQKAYEICHDCFDAILFQVDLEENSIKRENLLNNGLAFEKERLEKEKYFSKDNIGHFYAIFETRPYIRGLYQKASYLLVDGKFKQAINVCKEILRLNENDNSGTRYLLMTIYATIEEENELLKLYKKYPEENLEMLFPLFALYYKLGDDKKAKEYLKKIIKANPNFVKFFNGKLKRSEKIPEGYYSVGQPSEIIMYFNQYDFLVNILSTIDDFILENS